jgi:hypothetical protein
VGLLALCALAYGWLFNFAERVNNPNEQVRIHAVVALADHRTYAVARRTSDGRGGFRDAGPVRQRFGVVHDEAIACEVPGERPPACTGNLYAAKAPGLSLLGVPPYLALRAAWGLAGRGLPPRAAIVWWLRIACVVVPTLLAWVWLAGHLAGTLDRAGIALAVVLVAALGSLSLTYGQMFAGHQPAALALLLAFGAVVRAGAAGRRGLVALAGFAAAAAAALEYPAAPAGALLLAWLLLRRRRAADLGWLAAGATLPLALLAHFHTAAFGAPWRFPYAYLEDPGFAALTSRSPFGIGLPTWEKVAGSLLSPSTGLLFWMPWVALAPLGALAVRRGAAPGTARWLDRRAEAAVACLVCLYYLWLQCSYQVWRGGWVVGPRHLTALVPFAAIAAGHGLDAAAAWLRRSGAALLSAAGAAAIAVTGAASSVSQGFPEELGNPLGEAVGPLLANGWIADNPLLRLGVPGPWSGLPYFLALAAGALWAAWLLSGEVAGERRSARAVVAGLTLAAAAALVAGLWSVGPGRTRETDRALVRLMRDWRPPQPPGARSPPGLP